MKRIILHHDGTVSYKDPSDGHWRFHQDELPDGIKNQILHGDLERYREREGKVSSFVKGDAFFDEVKLILEDFLQETAEIVPCNGKHIPRLLRFPFGGTGIAVGTATRSRVQLRQLMKHVESRKENNLALGIGRDNDEEPFVIMRLQEFLEILYFVFVQGSEEVENQRMG